ncbi:MAG: M20/M25/M40 family metallo-hydrolase [Nitrososphaerota archaeon]|nr:M20/M25/M40 family metallo-hydrolase [Nitrososphaerota archaeon]
MQEELELLLDSLEVYSPSTKEGAMSALLQDRMRRLGFRNVRTDEAGNAIGEVGSGRPHLLLCGHMDTIPGRLPVRREGDRIYGRGAADAKSPMCAMISAASQFDGPLHVTVACVTREEGDSLGVNTLIDAGGDYDAAVFGEPGGAQRLAVGYRGRIEARLTVGTPGGHAASSWLHPSAVDHALQVFSRMKAYERRKQVDDDHFRSVNISLTLIRGGSYSNVIPRRCAVTLDVRIPPGLSAHDVKSELTAIVENHAHRSPGVALKLAFVEPTEPYEAPTDSLVVRTFQRSILMNLKTRPIFTHKTGTGDMNTMAERMGIPCVTYGPGDSKLEHTDGEFVEVSDYLNSISVLKGVLGEFGKLSSAR